MEIIEMKEYYSPLPTEVTIGNEKVTIQVKSYEHGVEELIRFALDTINRPHISVKKREELQ
jgi:hypothetical protein